MTLRIAVIGAGWYGCHIALTLKALDIEVDVFEKSERPLGGSSANNQFRLHKGFHYARHYGTRMQSRNGFYRFIERYPTLSDAVKDNYYAVPKSTSLIDYDTYKLIMMSSGIDFRELHTIPNCYFDIDGIISTDERVLNTSKARSYFLTRLSHSIQLETTVSAIQINDDTVSVNGSNYDYAIDATWGHLFRPPIDLYYEPTILLYYKSKSPEPAFTLVDGPLCSIYPTETQGVYTLSSVPHTPLGRFVTPDEATARLKDINGDLVAQKRRAMEQQIRENFPSFTERFTFEGIQLGIKTKPTGSYDDRSCHVYQRGRIFSVMSGKIDTIFFATERILSLIEAARSSL